MTNTSDNRDHLTQVFPFLQEMESGRFDVLFKTMLMRDYPKGTVLLEEGHPCQGITLILDGWVRVYKLSPDGKEITLYRLGKGEACVLSISCAMGNADYPAIAEVDEDVRLAIIPAGTFKNLFAADPVWQSFVFDSLLNRFSEVMMLIEEIAFKSMDRRLATFLLEKIGKQPGIDVLEITHEEIAMELGTAREVVSRLLKNLERRGMLILSRGKIEVLNRKRLLELDER